MRKKPEKPPLRLVTSTAPDPAAPPTDLGESGARLWRSIMSEYRIDDAPGRHTLLQICHAADIAAHGRGMLKDELQARAFITRALRQMNFDVEPIREAAGRPPGQADEVTHMPTTAASERREARLAPTRLLNY